MEELLNSDSKIVVFDSYDTVMSANLVKTKLDAYGVPCFLTDEHFVSMVPIRNDLFPGVRLYIFEKDLEQVKEILIEEHARQRCPSCQSTHIVFEPSRKGKFTPILTSLLFGLFLPVKRVYICENCEKEFESLE
jgi:DNA-directed RNA polymerase subunit RPC12/RpoP